MMRHSTPDDPANFTLQFKPDGTVAIQADSNQVGGTYTIEGSLITIELGPSTMAACPEGSLADQFVAQLNAAAIYFIAGQNRLSISSLTAAPCGLAPVPAIWSGQIGW